MNYSRMSVQSYGQGRDMKTKIIQQFNKMMPRDPLFRLLLINGMIGLAIAATVFAGIFYANIGNLRVLVGGAENPFVPIVMLAAGLIITLVSVVTGSAIMLVGASDQKGGGKGLRFPLAPQPQLKPIPVVARPRSPRTADFR